MPFKQLDRHKLHIKPLSDRPNKVFIEKDHIKLDQFSGEFNEVQQIVFNETVERIKAARANNRPVILAFGAHSIKNGLAPVFIDLMERGWVTHLATNGAGIIHDWEFSFQGESSECVKTNVNAGQFGIWEETGFYINLAIVVGAYQGLGYGESVGAMIHNEFLTIPSIDHLKEDITVALASKLVDSERAAAAADLIKVIQEFGLQTGQLQIPHPFKKYGVQAAAYRLGIPFTGHPMIGHDIIYNHPMNHGGAIGRSALRDFLSYASSINELEGGVYLSVGSAVMSPMIFEKSLAMAQNLHIQRDEHIDHHYMVIVDLAESSWDWQHDGEPPMDDPAYYLRYCKTFSRMGGEMRYLSADNRDFLLKLSQTL